MREFDILLNNIKQNDYVIGKVASISPLKVYLDEDINEVQLIPAVALTSLMGVKIGSRVVMFKYGKRFVCTGVIGTPGEKAYCLLTKTNAQSIPSGTYTAINFSTGTVKTDPLDMYSDSNPTRITVSIAGMYLVNVSGRFEDSSATDARLYDIRLNGNTVIAIPNSTDGSGRSGNNLSLILDLNVGDYLEFYVWQGTGSNKNIGGGGAYGYIYLNAVSLLGGMFNPIEVSVPAFPEKCGLLKVSTQSIPNASATKVTFSSGDVDYDPLNMLDDSNDRLIIPTSGWYDISANARWASASGDNDRIMYIYVNGSGISSSVYNVGSAGRASSGIGIKKYLYANDFIELYAWQNSGSSLNVGGTSYNSIFFNANRLA